MLEEPLLRKMPTLSINIDTAAENEASHHGDSGVLGGLGVGVPIKDKRVYAVNKPRIFLETLSGRTASMILILTYFFFIACELIDIQDVQQSFKENSSVVMYSYSCSVSPPIPTPVSSPLPGTLGYGCLQDNSTWIGTIKGVQNVISIQLSLRRDNITASEASSFPTDGISVPYSLNVWACYEPGGCGSEFAPALTDDSKNLWHQVLTLSSSSNSLLVQLDKTNTGVQHVSYPLFSSTFQNQESIPTNGLVKSYYIAVSYSENAYNSLLFTDAMTSAITYSFDIVTRPASQAFPIATIILMFFTFLVMVFYIAIVQKEQSHQWLPEQQWLVVYFVALLIYQNPVYCTLAFLSYVPAGAAYASYFLDALGQAIFLVVWLFFADSVQYKESSLGAFFGPKVSFGLVFFATSLVTLTFQFPDLTSVSSVGTNRSPTQAVYNWPTQTKITFSSFSLVYLLLFLGWAMWWLIRLFFTSRHLNRLPYMSTRYLQLSFRFFALQAILVTVYYVTQYALVIYNISNSQPAKQSLTSLSDNINTLFRQQTQLFGKVLFLTVYAMFLAFMFLPSSYMENKLALALAATYVITEDELHGVRKQRRAAIGNLNKMLNVNNLVIKAKTEVFCIELATHMLNVSFEAYYDPPDLVTTCGSGPIDLERHGFVLLKSMFDPVNETFAMIVRHTASKKVVVAFRGTKSSVHWKNNLNYTKRDLDVLELPTSQYDASDGMEDFFTALSHSGMGETAADFANSDDENEDEDDDEEYNEGADDEVDSSEGGRKSETSHSSGGIKRTFSTRSTFVDGAGKSVKYVASTIGGGLESVMEATAGLVTSAAKITPILQGIVKPHVHSGFWKAYEGVRDFVHTEVRNALKEQPGHLFFTGHSLGGALATFAALDVQVHTLPRLNKYHYHRWLEEETSTTNASGASATPFSGPLASAGRGNAPVSPNASPTPRRNWKKSRAFRKIKLSMYNYGSPKVGNGSFATLFNKFVPDAFRIVVDGDVVTTLPPTGYKHIGTEIVVDAKGAGSIIIDPSFVERWLRSSNKGVSVHLLGYYKKGLAGVKRAAEFLQNYEGTGELDVIDIAFLSQMQSKIISEAEEERAATTVAPTLPAVQEETHDLDSDDVFYTAGTRSTPGSVPVSRQASFNGSPRRTETEMGESFKSSRGGSTFENFFAASMLPSLLRSTQSFSVDDINLENLVETRAHHPSALQRAHSHNVSPLHSSKN